MGGQLVRGRQDQVRFGLDRDEAGSGQDGPVGRGSAKDSWGFY